MSATPPVPVLSGTERSMLGQVLEAHRRSTSARLADLVAQLDAVIEACALSVSDDEHDPEGATLGFERAQVAALVGEARRELAAVDRAQDRLAAGTYGACERCGRDIGIDRLVARPTATTCVPCATGADGVARLNSRE